MPKYSLEDRKTLHGELVDINGNIKAPMSVVFLNDYKVLRDQAKVK